MTVESARRLSKCELHGLHYDPAVQNGCVVCLRPSAAAPPLSGRKSPGPSFAPKRAAANSGWTVGFAVLRIAITLVLLFFIGAMAMQKNPENHSADYQLGGAVASVAFALLIGMLPLALARFRNLRGITYSLLISAIIEVLWQGSEYKEHRATAVTGVEPLASFTSKDGLITLRAPQSWKAAPSNQLRIASDTATAIFTMTEDAAKFAPSFGLAEFLNVAEGAFAPVLSAHFTGAAEGRTVAGARGMRVPFDGVMGGLAFKGYLYVVQGGSHFHAFAAMFAAERADFEERNVTGYVEQARIGDVP